MRGQAFVLATTAIVVGACLSWLPIPESQILYAVAIYLAFLLVLSVVLGRMRLSNFDSVEEVNVSKAFARKAYLAVPMAAYDGNSKYVEMKSKCQAIADRLELFGVDVCYPAKEIKDQKHWEDEAVALSKNYDDIFESRYFILVWPERLPSSVLFEAGVAFALGKTCFFFYKKGVPLPFLLRKAPFHNTTKARVIVKEYEDERDVLLYLDINRKAYFV